MNMTLSDPPVVVIEGVPFLKLRMREVVNLIIERHSAGCGGWVVTPNIDILRRLVKDASFRALVAGNSTLYTADGTPIVWLSHLLGKPLPERVAGSDLIVELVAESSKNSKTIYFLGGNPGVATQASQIFQNRFPALRVTGCYSPPFGFEHNPAEMKKIQLLLQDARPDIIFVGLGSPKQEHLIASMRDMFPTSWWLGIGVSFSFVTGDVQRAPMWMRKTGLEWLHRTLQEPKRLFKRYVIFGIPFLLVLFIRILIKRALSSYRR